MEAGTPFILTNLNLRRLGRGGTLTLLLCIAAFALVVASCAYLLRRLPFALPALPDAWPFVGLYGGALLLTAWLANHGRRLLLTGVGGGSGGCCSACSPLPHYRRCPPPPRCVSC